MARIILLLFIVTLATVAQAGVGTIHHRIPEGFPMRCVDETGSYPEGSTWYLEGCQMKDCSREGDVMITTHRICISVVNPEGCKMVENRNLNFPGCCPMPVCP